MPRKFRGGFLPETSFENSLCNIIDFLRFVRARVFMIQLIPQLSVSTINNTFQTYDLINLSIRGLPFDTVEFLVGALRDPRTDNVGELKTIAAYLQSKLVKSPHENKVMMKLLNSIFESMRAQDRV